MPEKKSWRDFYKVHPAADVFPMLPEDELRKLGEDIAANGLKEPIALFRAKDDADAKRTCILDGRNRLAAIVLVGLKIDPEWPRSGFPQVRWIHSVPEAYVISKNIHRRHLTKEQQADLIVKVMKAQTDFAKVARSVKRDSNGRVNGSAKDPFKAKVVEQAKKHGISKRTAEKAIANDRGPTHLPARAPVAAKNSVAPKAAAGSVEDIVRKIMAFVERNLSDKSYESLSYLSEQLISAIQGRIRSAPRKLSRPELNGEWETVQR